MAHVRYLHQLNNILLDLDSCKFRNSCKFRQNWTRTYTESKGKWCIKIFKFTVIVKIYGKYLLFVYEKKYCELFATPFSTNSTWEPVSSWISWATFLDLSTFRLPMMTLAPRRLKAKAVSLPIPEIIQMFFN